MSKNISHLIILGIILTFVVVVCICEENYNYGFDEEWIIGKTSVEVEQKYGKFDSPNREMVERQGHYSDGLFRDIYCEYIIHERMDDFFWGVREKKAFCVRFDENGVAVSCFWLEGGEGG